MNKQLLAAHQFVDGRRRPDFRNLTSRNACIHPSKNFSNLDYEIGHHERVVCIKVGNISIEGGDELGGPERADVLRQVFNT